MVNGATPIRIVLMAPSHGGNVGGCARAMKNMGLSDLTLVSPTDFPSDAATARAAGAEDILDRARVCPTLDEAIGDCRFVIGTSARDRKIPWPLFSPRDAAREAVSAAKNGPVAILFGRERTGLTNVELDRCQALVTIPTDPEFSSLNLVCAVQIVAYEIRLAESGPLPVLAPDAVDLGEPVAAQADVERFYRHLESVMTETGFLDPGNPRLLMRRLMRLFNRAQLTQNEVNILRGVLTSVQQFRARRDS